MPVEIQASRSGLLRTNYDRGILSADFTIPDDPKRLCRISFADVETFRVLDEMPLSTEDDDAAWDGHIPEHVAYRVEDAFFWRIQSDLFRQTFPRAQQYQFITGLMCLDVISLEEPALTIVAAA